MDPFKSIAQMLHRKGRSRPDRAARPATRRAALLRLEAMEDRAEPAFVGGELTVKNDTAAVFGSASASSSNGMSVAVYTRATVPGNNDIGARLFFPNGTSKELSVASGSSNDVDPSVAMDANGNFVVSWTQAVGNQADISARRFSSTGQSNGFFLVAGGVATEADSDVAMDANGNIVFVYTRANGSGTDVLAERFKVVNGELRPQGSTTVSSLSGVDEYEPSVAMDSGGNYAVAYTSQNDGANPDVKLKKFNSDGALQLTRTIAGGAGTEQDPSVSMDALGNMVVAYERFFGADVHANARRVSSAGELGGEIFVGNFFNRDSTDPEVALSNSGAFVMAFNFARPDGSNAVRVTEVGADDFIRAGAEHIIETPGQATFGPSVSIDGSGRYFVTYQRNNAGDLNVFGQRGQLE